MAIAEELGKESWWGILVGLIPILIIVLAFGDSGKKPSEPTQPTPPPAQ